jgi:hypothetical protein
MEMVSLIAGSWGVDLLDDGAKAVWCELPVVARTAAEGEQDAEAILAAWSDESDPVFPVWPDDGEPVVTGAARQRSRTSVPSAPAAMVDGTVVTHIVLLGYPVLLGIRAREHTSAILRECALLSQSGDETSAPARLVALATMMTSAYSGELAAADEQRMAAWFAGAKTVDMHYPFVPNARRTVEAWRAAMVELDTFAAGSALLTVATPADMVELRDWTVDEFVRQSEGLTPRPWSGPLD